MVERTADERIRTTEWEDIQYKHGNKVGKYVDGEFMIAAQKIADGCPNVQLKAYDAQEERVRDKLERGGYDVDPGTTAEELVEGDDEEGGGLLDDDDDALAAFRQKRMTEMKKQEASNVFGVVRHIAGEDYVREITEASDNHKVVALMLQLGHEGCDALLALLRQVASRQRDVKFVSIISTDAIPKFPQKQLPCVLLYDKRQLVAQLTTLAPWGDKNMSVQSVEKVLGVNGIIKIDDEEFEDEDEDGNFRHGRVKTYQTGL